MKIAYIKAHPDIQGGGNRFVYETASRLQKLGHKVMMFCDSMNKLTAYPQMLQIPYQVFRTRRALFGQFRAYYSMKTLNKMIKEAFKWKPDIIFPQMIGVFVKYIQKTNNIPIVPFVHGLGGFSPSQKSWTRNAYRKLPEIPRPGGVSLENLSLILCNSHYTEKMIHELVPNANTEVTYPGVDHGKFKPTWKDKGYLYYHSRYGAKKNQLLAIRAAGKNYPLILSGFLKKSLKYHSLVKNEAMKYNHKVLTNIGDSEMLTLLQNCSVFLFPSVKENFGIAPIEAMACGKPVIGHNSGGPRETVGKVGLLCGDDEKEWRKAIEWLMENPSIRKKMGKEARKLSLNFTWENTVNHILESFEQVIK